MDFMNFSTPDQTLSNIEKIGELFPSVITEMRDEKGNLKKGINFETLKQLLSPDVVDGEERYEFTWVGKKAAMAEAARPITKTLRPVKKDSRDWDTTENLYIEGDNLEALKILQESYLGKVKMIYIDPPYNTGKDFIYRDKFRRSKEDENIQAGIYDETESQLFENTESNGRFHSDWCSMMLSRLNLTRNLLTEDGVIFISIDDNEMCHLREICNEVFGENNFQASIVWRRKRGKDNSTTGISRLHEYLLVYSKSSLFSPNRLPMGAKRKEIYSNPDNDPKGEYVLQPTWASGMKKGPKYSVEIDGIYFNERMWLYSKETLLRFNEEGRLSIKGKHKDGNPNIYLKVYLRDSKGIIPDTIWNDAGNTGDAINDIKEIFAGEIPFGTPKPIKYIKNVIKIGSREDDIILDFFSGSATTAHAVMQLNAEDGGHRKFIMVQLPEPCGEKTEAYKAGYKNICEIGKERIWRAGDKIKSEHPDADLDIGFRVFRVDESNMKDVYYHPEAVRQQDLFEQVSNIKEGRTDMDLLYACLLDWGVEIHLPHTQEIVEGCTVHDVDGGALMACFDEQVPVAVVEYMAKKQPLRVVFRDSAFASDAEKINVTEIFKNLSPDTKVKVL